ncbi:amino acid permease 2-like [Cryptomeria japonica]|uniref:amino acid permease 2-like n=1 Tax=Cryptomeria japonica TaxID=3369 RepID=UPI0027DA73E7|nr:amino acid permease 2-like [Cryptomeria japonica]
MIRPNLDVGRQGIEVMSVPVIRNKGLIKANLDKDTIKSPPRENKTMKKAIMMGMIVTTLFYMSVGLVGYATFGNDALGNMFTGFGFYEPFWLIDIGNLCIVIHLVGPIFAIIEEWASHKWKRNGLVHTVHIIRIPLCGSISFTIFSLLVRSLVVVSTTVLAMLLPFFNTLMGFIGAVSFWPLTVYLPIQMYLTQTNVQKWSSKWVLNQSLSLICFLIIVAGIVGAITGISQDLRHVTIFDMKY